MLKTMTIRATIAAILAGLSMSAHAIADTQRVDIPAGNLLTALETLAKQANVDLVYQDAQVKGLQTGGVIGELSPHDAVVKLLQGTPLKVRRDEASGAILIMVPASSPPATSSLSLEGRGTKGEGSRAGGQETKSFWSRLRLAQSDTPSTSQVDTQNPSPSKGEGQGEDAQRAQSPKVTELEEIVVTGTHIRGQEPLATVLTISPTEIAQTGYATVQDWIDTLPQNFSGVPNEENGGGGNFNKGTSVNLRGLGSGATLVLVNGRRQPVSGTNGDFVDISTIPASAIERVEILTDGVSALYGSDAIGGVVNIVLRKDFDGAESKLRYAAADGGVAERTVSQLLGTAWTGGQVLFGYQYYDRDAMEYSDRSFTATTDKRGLGGDDFRSPDSNPGNIYDPFTFIPAYGIPSGQDGRSLTAADLLPGVLNLQNQFERAQLLPDRTMHSAFLSASQRLMERFEVFAEGRYSERRSSLLGQSESLPLLVPDSNPFFVDPFGGLPFVLVGYSFIDDFGPPQAKGKTKTAHGTLGLSADLGASWKATLSTSWGQEKLDYTSSFPDLDAIDAALADPDPETAFNPFGDGSNTNPATLARLRLVQKQHSTSEIGDAEVIADGPLFSIPGGQVKLALGADHRREELNRGVTSILDLSRDVTSAYAELVVPFIGDANSRPGAQKLTLSAAGRYERYSDFGDTANPKLTLRYSPFAALEIRGSWGTSFRAPKLLDLTSALAVAIPATLPDPRSANGFSSALVRFGGSRDLGEETAETWTAGLDLRINHRSSLSLTYYDINYDDRIVQPGPLVTNTVLQEESTWSDIITRNPSREAIDEVCNDPNFRGGSRAACLASLPAAIVDFRLRNIARTHTSGLDLTASYAMPTTVGEFSVSLNGTYVFDFESAVTDSSPFIDFVDTLGFPSSKRARASISWERGSISTTMSLNHFGSYRDKASAPARSVERWNTVDARFTYATESRAGLYGGLEAALSVTNLFDKDPPFVNNDLGYDAFNATPLGRFVGLQLTKKWGSP